MEKLAIISGFLGMVKDKYLVYQDEDRNLRTRLKMLSETDNINGVELCYPKDFDNVKEVKELVAKYKLGVSAINFRSRRNGRWMRGSLTSELHADRREVVEDLKRAIDLSVELVCNRITTCPLNEGHDYIFEMEYNKAYDFFEETIGEAAEYNPNVKICLEYKQNGPRARSFIANAGEVIAFCDHLGLSNVGATLDIGHSLLAKERPAQAAVMLNRADRLFYVHLNDNDGAWDWDMIPGAYNIFDFLEFFYYLRKIGYDDWFAYDVFPKEVNTVQNFNAVTDTTLKLMKLTDKIDPEIMEDLLEKRNPAKTMRYLYTLLGV